MNICVHNTNTNNNDDDDDSGSSSCSSKKPEQDERSCGLCDHCCCPSPQPSSCVLQHQAYVPSTDPQVCCGSCRNVSCTFTNENGTADLLTVRTKENRRPLDNTLRNKRWIGVCVWCVQAGSSWVENCTRYDCMETTVGAVILASGVPCPPFNDTECLQVRTIGMHKSFRLNFGSNYFHCTLCRTCLCTHVFLLLVSV